MLNFLWIIISIVLVVFFSFIWINIEGGHRAVSFFLFIPLFTILGYIKGEMWTTAVASIFWILVMIFATEEGGVVSGILLGIESAAACLMALSFLPIFPQKIYDSIMLWIITGGSKILLIILFPIVIIFLLLIKASSDMRN